MSFVPDGTLLICENYNSPGRVGVVSSILGQDSVNINFMTVAPVSKKLSSPDDLAGAGDGLSEPKNPDELKKEALMILGIDRVVDKGVAEALVEEEGVLSASVVSL